MSSSTSSSSCWSRRSDARWGILPGVSQQDARLRVNTLDTLEQLARTKWVSFERAGPQITVRLAARGRRVLGLDS